MDTDGSNKIDFYEYLTTTSMLQQKGGGSHSRSVYIRGRGGGCWGAIKPPKIKNLDSIAAKFNKKYGSHPYENRNNF